MAAASSPSAGRSCAHTRRLLTLPVRSRSLIDHVRDLVVLRVDDDHLLTMHKEGMGLHLRYLRRDRFREWPELNAGGRRLADFDGDIGRGLLDLHVLENDLLD